MAEIEPVINWRFGKSDAQIGKLDKLQRREKERRNAS